jgi:hypothetical protein
VSAFVPLLRREWDLFRVDVPDYPAPPTGAHYDVSLAGVVRCVETERVVLPVTRTGSTLRWSWHRVGEHHVTAAERALLAELRQVPIAKSRVRTFDIREHGILLTTRNTGELRRFGESIDDRLRALGCGWECFASGNASENQLMLRLGWRSTYCRPMAWVVWRAFTTHTLPLADLTPWIHHNTLHDDPITGTRRADADSVVLTTRSEIDRYSQGRVSTPATWPWLAYGRDVPIPMSLLHGRYTFKFRARRKDELGAYLHGRPDCRIPIEAIDTNT